VKISQFAVKLFQFAVKLFQFAVKHVQFAVKLFQFAVKLFQIAVKLFQKTNCCEMRVNLCKFPLFGEKPRFLGVFYAPWSDNFTGFGEAGAFTYHISMLSDDKQIYLTSNGSTERRSKQESTDRKLRPRGRSSLFKRRTQHHTKHESRLFEKKVVVPDCSGKKFNFFTEFQKDLISNFKPNY